MHALWKSYLIGQCFNALKVSLWWTALSPVALAMVNHDSVLGAIRVGFNIALMLLSPIAGVLVERTKVERILVGSTLARGFLWGICLPMIWFAFDSNYMWSDGNRTATMIWLVIISMLDGCAVAFSNVVDIDSGGVDLLGAQHNLPVDDAFRNRMNSIHQIVFDTSFLVFTPLMALLGYYVGQQASSGEDSHDLESGGIVIVFGMVFIVCTVFSFYYYEYGMKAGVDGSLSALMEDRAVDDSDDAGTSLIDNGVTERSNAASAPPHDPILKSMLEGARLCWHTKPVRWRLFFLGLEVALEDGMVAVVAAEYALTSKCFADGNKGLTLLYTALIVAVGKVGAIAAGKIMHSLWIPPTTREGYYPLFGSVLCGGASVCLLSVAHAIEGNGSNADPITWVSRAVVLTSAVMFFLFSTAPKIGFATVLQGMASSVEGSGKIFGFVGPFISIMDSIVVMTLALIFQGFKSQCYEFDSDCEQAQFSKALVCVGFIYLGHGIVEFVFGPKLMLPSHGTVEGDTMLQNLGLE